MKLFEVAGKTEVNMNKSNKINIVTNTNNKTVTDHIDQSTSIT